MRRLIPILLALCALFPASPARADARLVASQSRVRPGDTVVLEWSGLPARSEEVELELSLDGGRWVRISPELEAREGRFAWRVPAGVTGQGELRLRAGEAHDERVVAVVAIMFSASAEPPAARLDATSDWWNLSADSHAPLTDDFAGSHSAFAPLTVPDVIAPATDGAGLAPAQRTRFEAVRRPPAEPPSVTRRAFSPPRSTPLRN